MSKKLALRVLHISPTMEYAAQELSKYLRLMADEPLSITLSRHSAVQDHAAIQLGLFSDFGIATTDLADPQWDDAIAIDVDQSHGFIAGSNPRSVLIAVYRFLEANGCRWLRPGPDGDYVPTQDPTMLAARLTEQASYRHRGMCIEGSVSLENMLASVEWAPKVGLNSYMLEWDLPFHYFDKWYSHKLNPYKESEERSLDECRAYKTAIAAEIKRRGMIYHDMGHGWTCAALGLPTELVSPWDRFLPEIPAAIKDDMNTYLALVNGKRQIMRNSPLNSNLCYGQPEVQRRLVEAMLRYCIEHPQVDVLHFWLGDSWNTQCECDLCLSTTPADFMLQICNQLDEALTEAELDTKIAFIAYVDTIWPPAAETISNPDRFLLLYAPISRTYSTSYDPDTTGVTLQPYVRNQLPRPRSVKENLGYLKEWFKIFSGDSLCFEYHFWKDNYNDPGYYQMAEILSQDIKAMHPLNLNGIIEDQTQRAYFPTGFPMYLYGRTLWDKTAQCSELADTYFTGAFGPDGPACLAYMKQLSSLFDPPYLRGDLGTPQNLEAVRKLAQVPAVVHAFRPTIEANIEQKTHPAVRLSWQYLNYHATLAELLSHALRARAEGHNQAAQTAWEQTYRFAFAHEETLQPVFDVHDFTRFTANLFADR